MESTTLLQPPEYTEEEQGALLDFVLALKKPQIQDFLKGVELPKSGTKPALRERLQGALDAGDATYEQVVDFLDSVAPWGKQHVFLYTGPRGDMGLWKDPDHVLKHLKASRVERFFNARLPLILPEELTLSSIAHTRKILRATAVQKREYTERRPEHDDEKEGENDEIITLKAYAHYSSRTLVAFEWDLDANTAMLQITQLHRDALYEEVAKEFLGLVSGWLDIENMFGLLDIRKVIRSLHELERNGHPEARSHRMEYRTLRGRRLSANSPSPQDSVLGEAEIDNPMDSMRKKGVPHLGNFYWLAGTNTGPATNPLNGEVRTIIVGSKLRINFPTPNTEDMVRYVLHRVRALS